MRQEIAQELAKAAPPVTVTSWAWLNGLTLDKWVAIATLIYIVLQAAHLVWKWWREFQRRR